MPQIRAGDLLAVRKGDTQTVFAILTKQVLFGGHWAYVFHDGGAGPQDTGGRTMGPGFNCAVDFIVPKREGRIVTLTRGNDFASLMGPELLQQEPPIGMRSYGVWRWKHGRREEAELIRFTLSPTVEERSAPHYSCIPADMACELAARRWRPSMSMWTDSRP
jgi:hypothetical protein